MTDKAKWTFMVYLAGDNNLSNAGEKDLNEMRAVGSTAQVNIVVEFDRIGDDHETKRYHIQRNGVRERIESLGETDCGDPNTLIDFVKWATGSYPAECYALVLWNHGCGWAPLEMDKIARAVGPIDYNEREAIERSASPLGRVFFRTTLERIFSLPSNSERAICSDDGTGHSLDTIEIGNVLARIVQILGQPLDLLGLDACLMSNLEVAVQAQPYVKYIVASEENEPADGWPYDDVLEKLVANPNMATAELARHIVDLYVKSYQGHSGAITQAALDTTRLMDVVQPLDRLAYVLANEMEKMQTVIWKAQRNSANFWHFTLWDLAQFCAELGKWTERRIEDEATKNTVLEAVTETATALQKGANKFVIAEGHQGAKVAHCGGISIYLPSVPSISDHYYDLDFAKQHHWSTMIRTYLEM